MDALCASALPTRCSCGRSMLGDLSFGEASSRSIRAAGCLVRSDYDPSGVLSLSSVSDRSASPPDSTKGTRASQIDSKYPSDLRAPLRNRTVDLLLTMLSERSFPFLVRAPSGV